MRERRYVRGWGRETVARHVLCQHLQRQRQLSRLPAAAPARPRNAPRTRPGPNASGCDRSAARGIRRANGRAVVPRGERAGWTLRSAGGGGEGSGIAKGPAAAKRGRRRGGESAPPPGRARARARAPGGGRGGCGVARPTRAPPPRCPTGTPRPPRAAPAAPSTCAAAAAAAARQAVA